MKQKLHAKPVPHPSPLSAPYWEGARQGKLMLQRCGSCGAYRHYPQWLCARCQSADTEWTQASGCGKVYSWTTSHHAFHPGFIDELPYTMVTVDMEEGVRVLGRFKSDTPLKLDLPVQLHFEADAQGTPVPIFDAAAA